MPFFGRVISIEWSAQSGRHSDEGLILLGILERTIARQKDLKVLKRLHAVLSLSCCKISSFD